MTTLNLDEVDLDYTRSKRRAIVDKLTDKGIPDDPEALNIILKTLDGIDRPALVKMRIKADEGISNQQATSAAALAQLYMNPKSKQRPVEIVDLGADDVRQIPELPQDLVAPSILPGELDVSPQQDTYDSFMERQPEQPA